LSEHGRHPEHPVLRLDAAQVEGEQLGSLEKRWQVDGNVPVEAAGPEQRL
jgi:hypothetical protein